MKKAQMSIEFIILASVVILLSAFFAANSIKMGDVGSNLGERGKKAYWEGEDIEIIDVWGNNSALNLTFRNNLDYDIELVNISLNGVLFSEDMAEINRGDYATYYMPFNYTTGNYKFKMFYTNIENNQIYSFEGYSEIFIE